MIQARLVVSVETTRASIDVHEREFFVACRSKDYSDVDHLICSLCLE